MRLSILPALLVLLYTANAFPLPVSPESTSSSLESVPETSTLFRRDFLDRFLNKKTEDKFAKGNTFDITYQSINKTNLSPDEKDTLPFLMRNYARDMEKLLFTVIVIKKVEDNGSGHTGKAAEETPATKELYHVAFCYHPGNNIPEASRVSVGLKCEVDGRRVYQARLKSTEHNPEYTVKKRFLLRLDKIYQNWVVVKHPRIEGRLSLSDPEPLPVIPGVPGGGPVGTSRRPHTA